MVLSRETSILCVGIIQAMISSTDNSVLEVPGGKDNMIGDPQLMFD
jgi:hypothetical protein